MSRTNCEQLKKYFKEDLASDWNSFQKALAGFQETKINHPTDGPTWWKKRVDNTMGLMMSFIYKARESDRTSFRVEKYYIATLHDSPCDVAVSYKKELSLPTGQVLELGDSFIEPSMRGLRKKTKYILIGYASFRNIHNIADNNNKIKK